MRRAVHGSPTGMQFRVTIGCAFRSTPDPGQHLALGQEVSRFEEREHRRPSQRTVHSDAHDELGVSAVPRLQVEAHAALAEARPDPPPDHPLGARVMEREQQGPARDDLDDGKAFLADDVPHGQGLEVGEDRLGAGVRDGWATAGYECLPGQLCEPYS
jgi:hypothetical protein